MENNKHPLHFFENLISGDAEPKLWKEFSCIEPGNPQSVKIDSDKRIKTYLDFDNDNLKYDEVTEYYYGDFLINRIVKECKSLKSKIENALLIKDIPNQKGYINELCNKVNELLKKTEKQLLDPELRLIYSKYLSYIFNYLKSKTQTFKKTNDKESVLKFGLKVSSKRNQNTCEQEIRQIFNRLTQEGFISAVTVNEFISLIKSPEVTNNMKKIIFDCNAQQTAYILSKFKSLINNFEWKDIGKSELFFSRKGRSVTLNSDHLSKAYHKFINIDPASDFRNMIDEIFANNKHKQ